MPDACRHGVDSVRRLWILALALLGVVFGTGCTSTRLPAVPANLTGRAEVPGYPGVRLPMDPTRVTVAEIDRWLAPVVKEVSHRQGPLTLLALSGGGADGAYGAGVLNGWSKTGTRPVFDIVTGISTGSLIAPFAFLGQDYDEVIHVNYTTITDRQVFHRRSLLGTVFNGLAVADSHPLFETLMGQFDEARLAAIAAEHRKGRRLYVGSTDMDAEQLMCWDLGAIASSGRPDARELFCRILLASASIPVALPPVFFDVEADGRSYQEMHCDGGCMTQVFGFFFLGRLRELTGRQDARLYVIRNEILSAQWEDVPPSLVKIGGRAVDLLLRNQGLGDLFRAYLVATETGLDYNLAFIPGSFTFPGKKGEFDPAYMKTLYEIGYQSAASGTVWSKRPPGIAEIDSARGMPSTPGTR